MSSDQEGKLTPQQRKRAVDWLEKKAPGLKCAACGHNSFGVVDHLISPPVHYGGSIILGGPTYPQFMIVCNNCSHMMAFSAVATGVLDPSPPPPTGSPKAPTSGGGNG